MVLRVVIGADRGLNTMRPKGEKNYTEGKEAIPSSLFCNQSSRHLCVKHGVACIVLVLPNHVKVACRTGIIDSCTLLT